MFEPEMSIHNYTMSTYSEVAADIALFAGQDMTANALRFEDLGSYPLEPENADDLTAMFVSWEGFSEVVKPEVQGVVLSQVNEESVEITTRCGVDQLVASVEASVGHGPVADEVSMSSVWGCSAQSCELDCTLLSLVVQEEGTATLVVT